MRSGSNVESDLRFIGVIREAYALVGLGRYSEALALLREEFRRCATDLDRHIVSTAIGYVYETEEDSGLPGLPGALA